MAENPVDREDGVISMYTKSLNQGGDVNQFRQCGGQTWRRLLGSLPPGAHVQVRSSPLECGWDLWLASNQENMAKVTGYHICGLITYDFNICLAARPCSLLALRKQACLVSFSVDGATRQETEGGFRWQPARSYSYSFQGTECCRLPHELKNRSFPCQTLIWHCCQNSDCSIWLSHAWAPHPNKLWDNKYVLFHVAATLLHSLR